MSKRAAIYARVSRAYTENDERLSIETQTEDCINFCKERGYNVVQIYIDKEKYRARGKLVNPSGERKDRPGYLAMLKAAKNEEFDVIVSWREDRLYRGVYSAIPLVEVLEGRRGLSVELVREAFDPQMLMLKASIGKMELDAIRARTIRARQARVERGDIPGSPTRFGYQKVGKQWEVNEDEANIIRKIFEWYTSGENNMRIRARLNSMGISPRVGKVWSKSSVVNILTFGGYATGQFETTLDGKTYTIPVPTIISMSMWERAEATRAENKFFPSRNVREDYLVRNMVYCPCGWGMGAKTGGGGARNKKKYAFYKCTKRQHQPENQHPRCPNAISAPTVDKIVWDRISKIVHNPEIVQRAIDEKISALRDEQQDILDDAARIQRQMDDLIQERQWVIGMARKKKISEEDMEYQLAGLDLQMLDLKKKQTEHQAATAAVAEAERLKVWAENYLRDVETGIDILEKDPVELSEIERAELYEGLGAQRFEEKYKGDKKRALEWAILEEKRKIVRFLVRRVEIYLDDSGKKQVDVILFLDLTDEKTGGLVHNDQSLDYKPSGLDEYLQFKMRLEFRADELDFGEN